MKRVPLQPIITEYDSVEVVDKVTPEMEQRLFNKENVIFVDDEFIYFRNPSSGRKASWLWISHFDPHGWKYIIRNGKITISPSIETDGGYYIEHYFIRENKVIWLPDSNIEENKINYHQGKE